ncbi:MAG TPA: hypothetical protein PLF81_13845 [Candidatus Anammoximicrobium sp.]|nr:hypothetical protein [Candidatus Anammoximicrobium sp.]
MRRRVEGLAFLVLAAVAFSWSSAEGQETTRAPAVVISQATGMPPAQLAAPGYTAIPAMNDQPSLPGYAWPTYASHPNYAAVTYPGHYSPSAWPYISPFYPYPQAPLGWRNATLKWDDGWWGLDFKTK